MHFPVQALLAGKSVPFAQGENSAIAKACINGPARISFLGIVGDEQADPRYHGGPDKALHHYPADHYQYWASVAVEHPLLQAPGAFGENISTHGLTEDAICIGDRMRLGSAILEVSQGRQPCWKQGVRMAWPQLPALMVKERRSGWYYRVIEEGVAEKGDVLNLLERPLPEWSVRRVFGLLIGGEHKNATPALRALADMQLLFSGWRARAEALLGAQS